MTVAWVVVDLQAGLRSPALDDLAQRVAVAVVQQPGPVWATVQVNSSGGPLRELRGWHGCGEQGDQQLLEPVAGLGPEVVAKDGYSAAGVLLVQHLARYGAVYVVGADTDACVLATAVDLVDPGVAVVVPPVAGALERRWHGTPRGPVGAGAPARGRCVVDP